MIRCLKNLFLIIIFSLSGMGCSNKKANNINEDINLLLPFSDVNNTIHLSVTSACPNKKLEINQQFCILIENISQESVHFPTDLGTKLYLYMDNEKKWIEVQNKTNYFGEDIVLYPENEGISIYVNVVHPELPVSTAPVSVRVIVVGQVEGNKARQVGAYLDVIVQPENKDTSTG